MQKVLLRVAPIIVKFSSKDVARKVFKAKARLASTGIFVSKYLTKRRREILNAAKDKYGQRNAWSYQGQILAKPSVGSAVKKIQSIANRVSLRCCDKCFFYICLFLLFLPLFYLFFFVFVFFYAYFFFFFTGKRWSGLK